MSNPLLLVFGIIDTSAGVILAVSSGIFLGEVAKYLGFVLIGKGLWTIFTSIKA
jgi:hypothetical protein